MTPGTNRLPDDRPSGGHGGSPDLVVRGGRVFDPETGSAERVDLLVQGRRIAGVVPPGTDVGAGVEVIEAAGRTVVPGFIDTHTHLDALQCFELAYPHALAGGTTTIVTESHRFADRFGREGIEALLSATRHLPIDVFVTLPPGPFYRDLAGRERGALDLDAIRDLADHPRIVGVGEVFWNHVLDQPDDAPIWSLFETARESGGVVCGHGAGCRGEDLSAFGSIVDNDHELLEPDDVGERIRRGITPIGRCGSIRDDSDTLVAGLADAPGPAPCLCSDGMWPSDLVTKGYMDHVVARVIEAGAEPADAFRMATLNGARAFGLDDRGSLSPGSRADIVVLSDEPTVEVETVVSGGDVVVRDGDPLVEPRRHDYPSKLRNGLEVTGDVDPDTFRLPADGDPVNALRHVEGTVTELTQVTPPVVGGEYVASPENDLLKVASLSVRPDTTVSGFTGVLAELGLQAGAVATTDTWTYPAVLVLGADPVEMATAVQRLVAIGGGWTVVRDGQSVAEVSTPIAGTCSDRPVTDTARELDALDRTLEAAGVTTDQPRLAIGTIAALGMPWFKLSPQGYVDTVQNELVGLVP